MIEIIRAGTYYGKHATGSVVVADGHPVFHGPRNEAVAIYRELKAREGVDPNDGTPDDDGKAWEVAMKND